MKDFVSSSVKDIEISGIRKFYNLVSNFPDAISLSLGQPDFNIPKEVEEEIAAALKRGETKYTSNSGIRPLREEISKYLKSLNINYNSEEIIVTVGGSEGLYSSLTAVTQPGDCLLIPEIAYPAYENIVKILKGKVVYYKLDGEFHIDIKDFENKIKKFNPKAAIISFPSNPTGALLTKEDRDRIIRIIKENDLLVLSDEIYASLSYDEFYSAAQNSEIKDNIILVGGFSKIFSMTGLRIGYVAASKYLLSNILKVHQYNVSCAPSIIQYGALEGLKNSTYFIDIMKKEFTKRRDFVYNSLKDMGIPAVLPKGAFYIFPSIEKFNMNSFDFAYGLLEKERLAIVPGSAFGEGGEGYVRISYASSIEELELGMERLKKYIKGLGENE